MLQALQVAAALFTAVAMALSLAHALELPGKMRLTRDQYLATQPIYYPGFTIGGIAEPIGVLMTALLLFLIPVGSQAFYLTMGACLSLLAMHASYWTLTHPVNNFWLRDVELKGAGARFFSFASGSSDGKRQPDWTRLRNRWEYSHVVRAALGLLGLALLVTALAVS